MADTPTVNGWQLREGIDGIDWEGATAQLRSSKTGDEADALIDAMTETVFAGSTGEEAAPCLAEATRRAHSELSLRSAALALAIVAPANEAGAPDALVAAYGRVSEHPFLAPALLEALGLLAMRNPLARAQVSGMLLRLCSIDHRYLLVKAAQVIGRLDAVQSDSCLRAKLDELTTAQDLAVQAEARQQIALVELADVLLAKDRAALHDGLAAARAAFARAEASEEHRPDATMFAHLLDMLMAFLELVGDREAKKARVAELASQLNQALMGLDSPGWHSYRSDFTTLLATRALHISDALRQAAYAASVAEEWTNFGSALEELAWLYTQIRGEPMAAGQDARLSAALSRIADVVLAPALGPLLARVVQQRRLARVTADYVLVHGEDGIAQGLRALEHAAAAVILETDTVIPGRLIARVTRLAERVGRTPTSLVDEFLTAIEQGQVARWMEEMGLAPVPLPVERPDLYGGDPTVDEVVRPLLHQIAGLLVDYPLPKWARLADVLISLVKFVNYVRDCPLDYLVCAEDGGLGQKASESDLQNHLFEWLRSGFGREAVYELARTGGGRPDTGLVFPDARFPVEAKHEFVSIEPQHVRENFLGQSDAYATAADRVSFLMILDLRSSNAAGHRMIAKAASRAGASPLVAFYHLRDSFRAETLPADPDIPDATSKVVVIGLVPGNRPLPSSMSTYSKRPASARRGHK